MEPRLLTLELLRRESKEGQNLGTGNAGFLPELKWVTTHGDMERVSLGYQD